MRLAAGLNKAGYLGSLPCLFNTEEERFQQRFATLSLLIRPEPLSYSYYSRSMDMTGTASSLNCPVVHAGTLYGVSQRVSEGCPGYK